jgi:Tol biopolymer transport system component
MSTRNRAALRGLVWIGIVAGAPGALAVAQSGNTLRVSVDPTGADGGAGAYSLEAALSGDGAVVAFRSAARLAPQDAGGFDDVYVHERWTGATTLASHTPAGAPGNGASQAPSISADGRYVAFESDASDLVAGDLSGLGDVFVLDRLTGVVTLESVSSAGLQGNGRSTAARLGADGRFLLFASAATNLVAGDTNGRVDVFLRDRLLLTTVRVSVATSGAEGNRDSRPGGVSTDGRTAAFHSDSTNLAADDTNGTTDVFVRDLLAGTTTLVSRGPRGLVGNGGSLLAALSADGRRVAFVSSATNLVQNDRNGFADVFVRDLVLGTTVRASVASDGSEANSYSQDPSISADGASVAFTTWATNLAPDDADGLPDVLVRDLAAGTTQLASRPTATTAARGGTAASLSGDGQHVAFSSAASDLVPYDTNAATDVFVRDLAGCVTTVRAYCTAGTTTHGCQGSIAGSGTPSASAGSGFTITASGVEGQKSGLVFYGLSGPQAAPFHGTSSTLCVRAPHQRTGVQNSGGTVGACDGQLVVDWNQFIHSGAGLLGWPYRGGETAWAQAWFRDPLAPGGSNLSNALWFTVCP